MPTATIEERLTLLEQKMDSIAPAEPSERRLRDAASEPVQPAWWKRIVGVYKDDPEFAEAERLGREYRESLRPQTTLVPQERPVRQTTVVPRETP